MYTVYKMATIFKNPSSVLDLRSWLCDVRLVERLGPLPPDIQAEDNVENNQKNRAQKYPSGRDRF